MTETTIPKDLKYTREHEWVKLEADGIVTVGITDHAQAELGDIVYVDLPELDSFNANDECAVIESVKAASDIFCPISGEIVEVNDTLNETPELVNDSPYDEAWLFKLKPNNAEDVDSLLSAEAYQNHLADAE